MKLKYKEPSKIRNLMRLGFQRPCTIWILSETKIPNRSKITSVTRILFKEGYLIRLGFLN
jgi:hypothetical protein